MVDVKKPNRDYSGFGFFIGGGVVLSVEETVGHERLDPACPLNGVNSKLLVHRSYCERLMASANFNALALRALNF